jgi:hypothetical protein
MALCIWCVCEENVASVDCRWFGVGEEQHQHVEEEDNTFLWFVDEARFWIHCVFINNYTYFFLFWKLDGNMQSSKLG